MGLTPSQLRARRAFPDDIGCAAMFSHVAKAAGAVGGLDLLPGPDGSIVLVVDAAAGPDDFLQAFSAFLFQSLTPLVLWDLRKSNIARFTSEDIRSIQRELRDRAREDHAWGRSALLVARDADFGVAKMLIAYAEFGSYRGEFEVFRDEPAAMAWLL